MANRSTSLLLIGFLFCGVLQMQKLYFIFFLCVGIHISVTWRSGIPSPAFPPPPTPLQLAGFRPSSELEQEVARSLLGHSVFCWPDLRWPSRRNRAMPLSVSPPTLPFVLFLIRWISKIVAVQKSVVFFKKRNHSFSNILWNCFIPFISKPNVSRVQLLLSSNFDM